MLEPSRDRLDYGAMLRPPEEGFALEHAIASTYSLDLAALLAALLPLGFDGDAGNRCQDNPVFMLHALNKLMPKLHIFCDAACIKVPDLQRNRLLGMLDRVVFPVRRETAFHPKFWLLKFVRGAESRYRLAVLSKNITFDRSWDVAMFFDGKMQDHPANGAPLSDMLDFLKRSQWGKGPRLRDFVALIEEVKCVEFSNDEIQPGELRLIPFGVNSKTVEKDEFLLNDNATFYRLLVMSPFLSPNAVTSLFGRGREGGEKLLFTRKTALAGLTPEQLNEIQCYCVKDEIFSGESSGRLDTPPDAPRPQDIHAKIYLFQQYQNNTPYLYLGSANLTQNGTKEQNVELLMRVKLRGLNIYEKIRTDLLPADERKSVFEPCESLSALEKSEEEMAHDQLDNIFRKIAFSEKHFTAEVKPQGEQYSVTLQAPDCSRFECRIEIAPLNGNWQTIAGQMVFAPQSAEKLSDFYRVRLSKEYAENKYATLERLLVIDTLSAVELLNARQEAIESSCLRSSADLLEYLSYVLSEDSYALASQRTPDGGGTQAAVGGGSVSFALYEKMLYWAVADKEKILSIQEIIHRRHPDSSAETNDLLNLCETFYRAAGGEK